ncbi:MAG: L,D-transpeptidase [Puniceicoccales bacterium]|jgi:hypothetical protein|nr:L,D-transpeptidase [Puniceicoccales bacterium]
MGKSSRVGAVELSWERVAREAERHSQEVAEPALAVSVGQGLLLVLDRHGEVARYPAATGLCYPSCIKDSKGTPRGLHRVEEKFGDGLPVGEVLIGRRPTGRHFSTFANWHRGCHVVSRILRLRGLEDGINSGVDREGRCCDSYQRYIYIHGTAREDLVGQTFTGGCIALRAADLLPLYDAIPLGTALWIEWGPGISRGNCHAPLPIPPSAECRTGRHAEA